jgi:hypothetical protein
MSVEDRLFALAQQCRQQSGDSFLLTPGQLVPRLNGQAPDLHAEIRALAAAFEVSAAARIAAAANPEAEATTIASELAVRERLSMASVTPALTVARRIGPLGGASPSAPTPGGWAGDSMAVGAAPQPAAPPHYQPPAPAYAPPQPAPGAYYQQAPGYAASPQAGVPQNQSDKMKALSKNPLVMGALALVVGVLVYQNFMQAPSQGQQQPPPFNGSQGGDAPQPPPSGDGQTPPPQPVNNGGQTPSNGQMPMLQAPGSGGPMLPVQRHSSGAPGFVFTLQTPAGASPGMVLLPQGSWEAGPAGIGLATPGDTTGQNMATTGEGRFQLVRSNGSPVRLAQMTLAQDNLNTGGLCLMFRGQQGQQDVQLTGADFCVMNGACSQPIGCGKLQ